MVRARWCEALRSGKYQQGRRKLVSRGPRHCCLGVLVEVLDGWGGDCHPDLILPPDRILKAAGIDRNEAFRLAQMNDGRRATFAEIADEIEAR